MGKAMNVNGRSYLLTVEKGMYAIMTGKKKVAISFRTYLLKICPATTTNLLLAIVTFRDVEGWMDKQVLNWLELTLPPLAIRLLTIRASASLVRALSGLLPIIWSIPIMPWGIIICGGYPGGRPVGGRPGRAWGDNWVGETPAMPSNKDINYRSKLHII